MRFSIVKQNDVSFGTALHYALNWSYGRKALCGKEMRTTARDFEVSYKRVCGSCARIMASNVETDHALALRELTFQAGDTVQYTGTGDDDPAKVGVVQSVNGDKLIIRWDDNDMDEMYVGRLVHFTRNDCDASAAEQQENAQEAPAKLDAKLSPAMIKALVHFHRTGDWGNARTGTVCALLDRDLVGHSRKGINPDLITELGRVVLAGLGETVTEPPVLRIRDTRTGLVRRILGTSLTTNAPHTTIVWVQREDEQGAHAWSADELMSKWHDLVAIDENGQQNPAPTVTVGSTWDTRVGTMIEITAVEPKWADYRVIGGMAAEIGTTGSLEIRDILAYCAPVVCGQLPPVAFCS